jgi:BRCA1-associated protein
MLCGNIGCSRYANQHAKLHFDSTGHHFALELNTQKVWDYIGDEYIHRLVRNKTDGKLVELSRTNDTHEQMCPVQQYEKYGTKQGTKDRDAHT